MGGDLWNKLQQAVKAKNPWAVWVTKVKGHAKQEDVEEGTVREEEKAGNDKADEAADRRSKKEQERLAAAAGLYSRRNAHYQKLVGRIQSFIIKMKNEEKDLRQAREKEQRHLGEKAKPKTNVKDALKYVAEDEMGIFLLAVRPPRRKQAQSDVQHERRKEIRILLSHSEWRTTKMLKGWPA